MSNYQIKAGDTLSEIAGRFGVSAKAIQELNGIKDPNKIRAGQTINIPIISNNNANDIGDVFEKNTSYSPEPTQTKIHTIKNGENISVIAQKYGISQSELLAVNPQIKDPNKIRMGQSLNIPQKKADTAPSQTTPAVKDDSKPTSLSEKNSKIYDFAKANSYDINDRENLEAFVKEREGLNLEAYQDSKGVWTIGYGHTGTVNGVKIGKGTKITEQQAKDLLYDDVSSFQNVIKNNVKVPLTQNQFDALTSFVYNIGPQAFKESTMLKKLNNGDYTGAADEFARWNKSGGEVIQGLINRREKEKELFLKDLPN